MDSSSNKFIEFPRKSSWWLWKPFSSWWCLYKFQKGFQKNKSCCFTTFIHVYTWKLVEVDAVLYSEDIPICVNGHNSRIFQNGFCVPRGFHSGPQFLIIYLNNISCCFRYAEFLVYADDLNIFQRIMLF